MRLPHHFPSARARPGAVAILLAASLALAGCGRRGPLLPPPGTPESQASTTLPPETQSDFYETGGPTYPASPLATSAPPPGPSQPTRGKAPPVKAEKNSSFFLDPLL